MLFVLFPQAEYLIQSEIFQVCWSFPSPAIPRGPVWALLFHLPPASSQWDIPAEEPRSEAAQPAAWSHRSQSGYSHVYYQRSFMLCQNTGSIDVNTIVPVGRRFIWKWFIVQVSHLSLLANVWAAWQSVWTDFLTCTLIVQYIFMMCSRWLQIF